VGGWSGIVWVLGPTIILSYFVKKIK